MAREASENHHDSVTEVSKLGSTALSSDTFASGHSGSASSRIVPPFDNSVADIFLGSSPVPHPLVGACARADDASVGGNNKTANRLANDAAVLASWSAIIDTE